MPNPLDPQAPTVAGGSPSPPATAGFRISPEQLALLEGRGLISPLTPESRARLMQLDARLGVPQRLGQIGGFRGVLEQPIGNAAPPLPAPAPEPPPAPKRLSKEQERQAKTWESLADRVQWGSPNTTAVGATAVSTIPDYAVKLLYEMYPDQVKAGLVPIGWTEIDKLPTEEKALYAQLVVQRQKTARPAPGLPGEQTR